MMRKLALDYVNFAKECWVHTAVRISIWFLQVLKISIQQSSSEARQVPSDHYRTLYTCLSLFVVLYFPEHGLENAPVGDDLMEWLNTHFIEPSTEEGDHLSALEHPWADEIFWPYLTRHDSNHLSFLFLTIPQGRPSED